MYRYDFAGAEARFRQMTQENPGHPAGYVFLASLYWWDFSNNFEKPDPALEAKFFAAARRGIELAKAWKAGGGVNNEADLWLGGAYGVIGRWHVSQFEWIRAYLNGKKGYNYLKAVYQRDPENYDAALGVGEFEYLASRLPGLVRISALIFVRGDRDAGLRACTLAAEKGTFASTEAKLFLAAVYNENEHMFAAALKWMDVLVQDDPDNQFFRIGRAIVRFYKRDYAEAAQELTESLRVIESRPGDPVRALRPMAHYHLGSVALMQSRFEEADAAYTLGVLEKEYPERGWVSNCLLRRGQARDLAGRRKEALGDYQEVLRRRDFWDSRKLARKHVEKPASMADVMSQIYGPQPVQYDKN